MASTKQHTPAASSSENRQAVAGLLAMPQEIQNKIYALVFAELVHIQYDNHRPTHHVCRSPLSEKESYEAFMSSNTGNGTVRGGNKTGWICTPDNLMPFALLRVNHRIAEAAESVAVESTTFSFSSPDSVVQFVQRLPRTQHSLVRKIQLDMTMDGLEEGMWAWVIAHALLPNLISIRHIYLCLRVRAAMLWTRGYTISEIVEELDSMRPVLILSQFSLRSATAIIAEIPAPEPSEFGNPYYAPYPIPHYLGAAAYQPRLSSSDQHAVKKNFAGYIRKKLLRED